MPDLADLFPGFQSHWIDVDMGRIFARSGGSGPPLLLLHGFPQTHVCWHKVAPNLAEQFTLIVPDLRGYGWSSAPQAGEAAAYAKRTMAIDLVQAMERLGHVRFRLAGHDRGGRVAYRMALDHPGRVERLATLDIAPTKTTWERLDRAGILDAYHWGLLAQPQPFPETLIGKDPDYFLDWTLASWTADKTLDAFDPRALNHYRTAFRDPTRIAAACGDYRAGASLDVEADAADLAAGKRIDVPMLALTSMDGFGGGTEQLAEAWSRYAKHVQVEAIDSGHFMAEENAEATAEALLRFFGR